MVIAFEQKRIITIIQIAMNTDKIADLFEIPMGLIKPQSAGLGAYSSSYRIFNHTRTNNDQWPEGGRVSVRGCGVHVFLSHNR